MTKEKKEIITRLRGEGQGCTAIARGAGLSKDCVKIWCQRHGLGGVAVKKAVPEEDPAVCRNCGKPLVQIPGRKPRKFCCDECRVSWWNSHPEAVTRKAVYSFVKVILTNITYTGNMLFQKEYCTDPITKHRRKNYGEMPQYFVEDGHEAIIPMDEWQAVRAEFKRRKKAGPFGNKSLNTCCFTGKIKCLHCGVSYMHHHRESRGEDYWVCGNKKKRKAEQPCPVKGTIIHKVLEKVCAEVLGTEEFDESLFMEKVDHIEVPLRATLDFFMKDGTVIRKDAKSTGHRDCWTQEYRQKVSEQRHKTGTNPKGGNGFTAKIKCPTCGCNFRKQGSKGSNGSRTIYWCCADRNCGSKGLREEWLKEMCAEVMGTDAFSEDDFTQKIDLIITKSVSRFARNTVDSLTTIRKLKEHNVQVYFEKENIWTFDSKGELLLTIMSSLAQEESRSISENCTWGQRKRFADGKVCVPCKRFLAYDMGPDHNLMVNPQQAKRVKRIYGMFLLGKFPFQIANTLIEEGIPSPGGKDHWNASNIRSILTNEKYKGDALLQKTYMVDFLTKKKKVNEGEIPQYYVRDNHEAIIDWETFEMVQTLMMARRPGANRRSCVSVFSNRVKCADCGGWYGSKVWHSNDPYRKVIWQCNHKFDGQKCTTPTLTEEQIKVRFLKAANTVIGARERFIAIFERTLAPALVTDGLERELADLEAEINIAAELVEDCIRENAHVALDQAEYQKRYDSLATRYDKAKARHDEVTELIAERSSRRKQIELYFRELRKREPLDTFREEDWLSMVDHMTVYSKDDVRVTFKDGTEVET